MYQPDDGTGGTGDLLLMGAFAELDAYLAEPFSIDYWSDDAVGHAQTLVAALAMVMADLRLRVRAAR